MLQVPQTIAGKVVAVVWALMGITILGMFTATLTTKLQELVAQLAENGVQQAADASARAVANARVGVLNGSIEKHLVLQEGGNPVSGELRCFAVGCSRACKCDTLAAFADFFELLNALHNWSAMGGKEQQSLQGIALDHYQYLHYRRVPHYLCDAVRVCEQSSCCCARLATRIPTGSATISCNGRRAARSPSA